MANIIKPKRSNTAAKVPNTTELTSGELGVNMADRKVYINNGTSVVQVGAGNLSGLGDVAIATPANGQALTYNSTTSKWQNSSAGAGTVTSVGITPGTGVTVSNSPITTSGNITVGLSTKLTAIENLSGAGFITQNGSGAIAGRTLQAGTGISISHGNGSSQDPVITNSAPDQTVALTGGGATSISGTYPNFTISSVNTTYGAATSTVPGLIELGSDTAQTVAANAVSATASRSYALQVNAAGQGVVNVPWTDTNSGGTVTSVGGTGTVSGLTLSGTVTTSGNLTLGGTLAVTPSNFASQTANTFLAAPNGAAGVPTFRAMVAADVPTLNQNTTGTAANVTGTVAIANGGTGQTTRQNAMDALAGAVTSGQYLRGNGTDVVMSAIQAADVPTLNQNTTGSSATLTTTRTLWGQNFNGSANVTGALTSVGNITGTGAVTLTATSGTLGLTATGANIITATTNGVERVRIDTSGNVGIGTSSPAYRLDIKGGNGNQLRIDNAGEQFTQLHLMNNGATRADIYYNNLATALNIRNIQSGPLVFETNATERARIDSSGSLLWAKSADSPLTNGIQFHTDGTNVARLSVGGANSTGATGLSIYSTTAGAFRFFVSYSGQINATSTSITAISDQSLKENIRDLETGLTEIMALKPRRFDWKAETQLNEKDVAGFIAQEVEKVLPELVYDYQYNADETKKSLKMGDILPTLVKAIQEQQAIITALTARVEALEGAQA